MNQSLRILITLLLGIIIPSLKAQEVIDANDPYFQLVGEADEAIAEQRWEDAAEKLENAMRLSPDNPLNVLIMSNLGMMKFKAGDDAEALRILDEAHAISPKSTVVLRNRARVLMSLHREEAALADYEKLLSLDSAMVEARFYRGMLLLRSGAADQALADFKWMQMEAPDEPWTALGLATYYNLKGEYIEAAKHFTTLIDKTPKAEYYTARAMCYLFTDRLNEASADIADALLLDPTDGETYLYRAILNKMRYREDDARSDAVRAEELGISHERIELLLGK